MRRVGFVVAWVMFLMLTPSVASAQYVDPGSVSLAWQLLLAGVLGTVFTARRLILAAVVAVVNRVRRGKSEENAGK